MMDQQRDTKTPIKRRRHSASFKAQVLEEASQPGTSIAAVAQRHGLNANLIHKWRRSPTPQNKMPASLPPFVAVEPTVTAPMESSGDIVLELPYNATTIKIHWPANQALALAHWLKAITT